MIPFGLTIAGFLYKHRFEKELKKMENIFLEKNFDA